ncbi:MAG: Hpt domain-containing protein [Candidatus Dormibacteria bacterium]
MRIRQSLVRQPRALDELLELFISEAHQRVHQLGEALQRADPAATLTLAHGLRGSASSFGALHLARLCRELEQAGQTGGLTGLRELFVAIETELADVSCELRSLRLEYRLKGQGQLK